MTTVSVPHLLWYGNQERRIHLPSRWDTAVLEPSGFRKKPMAPEEIARAFENPIGSPSLADLTKGAGEVVIVFDDMTRPMPVSHVLPWVIGALKKGGVGERHIRFIPALGSHGAMNNADFRKKLGNDIVETYPIYNHNPYENCEVLGDSRSGTPVHLNREFVSCDIKIGIGCITPHVHAGFGGGGKIVFPGISGMESIHAFHSTVFARGPETTGLGKFDGNVMSREIEEVVRLSGLQMIVNGIINGRGEITDLFVGDPVEAHRTGVELAKTHYATPLKSGKDIVLVNAFAKTNEMAIGMFLATQAVNRKKGMIVLLVDSPEGQICHYLFGSFGKDYGGRLHGGKRKRTAPVAPEGVRVIVCSEHPDQTMCDFFASPEDVTITRSWDETLDLLEKEYPRHASVVIIPDGTNQYFSP
jgi:nickel-dependent lactate racemase